MMPESVRAPGFGELTGFEAVVLKIMRFQNGVVGRAR
jgi:hypothetical protein